MKKILLFVGVCSSLFTAYAATSPVVQVVSYKEPLGLYFSLQGWGSGSIIDNQGHIITNNHVVDDGAGGISDDFAICMTDNPSLPPRCHYTASVVSRDADADMAILQIDATDIFGKKVDFGALSTLTMDMDYVPKSGDTVVARGYPWVGANTITETQGIVSGTAQYNGNKYLKTDTLIAGGNSGGPLIYDGKMIGVNTFLIGGGYDPSLGYSLLISEAADLIDLALSETKKLQSNSDGFAQFLQKIDMFSAQNKIADPLITFDVKEKYTIVSYIPSMTLEAQLSDGSGTSVSSFGFYHMRTPEIKDVNELKNYIFRHLNNAPESAKYTLNPVRIGGRTFYEPIDIKNPENTRTKNEYIYVSMLDETHMMILFLSTPVPTKNTFDNIQKSVKEFVGNISFPSKIIFPEIRDIVLPKSDIGIKVRKNSSISYDMAMYDGILSYAIKNQQDFVMVQEFLGNFWSTIHIALFKNSFETQNNSVDMWMKNLTEGAGVNYTVKKKVIYQGHEGFLTCYLEPINDPESIDREASHCEMILFVGENQEYIISAQMILPKDKLKKIDAYMIRYLYQSLKIPSRGETIFTVKDQSIGLPYSDVSAQSKAYKETLSTLLSYGILQQRPQFEGDMPLLWREYFSLYIWTVYHKKMTDLIDPNRPEGPTFEKALSVLPIIGDDYAEDDEWQIDKINNLIRLLVAGGSLEKYDLDTIYDFSNVTYEDEGVYRDAWNKILLFEERYFGERIPIKSAPYTPQKIVTYNPLTGLHVKEKTDTSGSRFFRDNSAEKQEAEKVLQCNKSSLLYFSTECQNIRKNALIEALSYPVLTKGKAIQILVGYMDVTLWGQDVQNNLPRE